MLQAGSRRILSRKMPASEPLEPTQSSLCVIILVLTFSLSGTKAIYLEGGVPRPQVRIQSSVWRQIVTGGVAAPALVVSSVHCPVVHLPSQRRLYQDRGTSLRIIIVICRYC